MMRWESPTQSVRVAAVAVAAVSVLLSANTLGNDFTYDDRPVVLENTEIHSLERLPATVAKPYWPNARGKGLGLWRPVTTLVFGAQWAMWDGAAVGFHIVNVVLDGLVAALVLLLLAHLMPLGAALAGGLVFAAHPVHVEAVANIVGLADVLSTLLYLVACIVVVRHPARLGVGWTTLVCGLFGLACLTKESAITLPGAVLLLDGCRRDVRVRAWRDYLKKRWRLYTGLAVTAALVLAGRLWVLGTVADPFPPLGAEALVAGVPRIWTVLSTWPELLRLFLFPADLSAEYSPGVIPIAHGMNGRSIVGLVVGIGALVVALLCWRTGRVSTRSLAPRVLAFGIVWIVITLVPTSNLFFLTGVLLAERTLYLPSVGFAAVAGWMVAALYRERPRVAVGLLAVGLLLMGFKTVERNATWKNNDVLFATMIIEHPESGRAQWKAGDFYLQRGDDQKALVAYGRALGLNGSNYAFLTDVARSLLRSGHLRAGEHLLVRALEEHPEHSLASSQLALLYTEQGRWAEAETMSRLTLRSVQDQAGYQHLLSLALAGQGRLEEAVAARRASIGHGEDGWYPWTQLAELEVARGDTATALEHLDRARTRVGGPWELAAVDSLRMVLDGAG